MGPDRTRKVARRRLPGVSVGTAILVEIRQIWSKVGLQRGTSLLKPLSASTMSTRASDCHQAGNRVFRGRHEMGSVYKKAVTKPLPPDAEIVTKKKGQCAQWKNRRGKTYSAPLTTGRDGKPRIRVEAKTYTAKYRDGLGVVPVAGGERQRVAVVRALINSPKLLLADEPTGALDRAAADDLAQLLVELNSEEGVTIILVTHSLDLANRMTRVLELVDGTLKNVVNGGVGG